MLSRQHAKLQYTPCGWQLLDLESTNGVLHNGIRVLEALLQHGDEIRAELAAEDKNDQ